MGVALSEEANVLISIWGFSDTSKARRFGVKSQKIKGKSVWEAKFSRGAPAPQTPPEYPPRAGALDAAIS